MASFWPTLVNDPCALEKKEHSAVIGRVLYKWWQL